MKRKLLVHNTNMGHQMKDWVEKGQIPNLMSHQVKIRDYNEEKHLHGLVENMTTRYLQKLIKEESLHAVNLSRKNGELISGLTIENLIKRDIKGQLEEETRARKQKFNVVSLGPKRV